MLKAKPAVYVATLGIALIVVALMYFGASRSPTTNQTSSSSAITATAETAAKLASDSLPDSDPVSQLAQRSAAWAKALTSNGQKIDAAKVLVEATRWLEISNLKCNETGYLLDALNVQAGIEHAASWLYLRYQGGSLEDTTAFLTQAGYRLPELTEWKSLPFCADQLVDSDKRRGRHALTSGEAFSEIFAFATERRPRLVKSAITDGSFAGATFYKPTAKRPVPRTKVMLESSPRFTSDLGNLWRGTAGSTAWPVHQPPTGVVTEARRTGAWFLCVGWVLESTAGISHPVTVTMMKDPASPRWFIVAHGSFHEVDPAKSLEGIGL